MEIFIKETKNKNSINFVPHHQKHSSKECIPQ